MSGPGDVWRQAAGKWSEVVGQVGDADWDKPTTCDGWTVRELVDHAMHWQASGASALGADVSPGDGWATIEPALDRALDDPSVLDGEAESFGGIPKHQVLGLLVGDLLIHSWDLARSLGADDTLPPAAVEATMMGLQRMPEKMLRGENMFGPPVGVGDDASPQDRLIGFVGRRP